MSFVLVALPLVCIGLLIALIVLDVKHTALTRADVKRGYRRAEAWQNLHTSLPFRQPLPLTTPYSASPELMALLVNLIVERRPSRVVELGSGLSTLMMAYALERFHPEGRIVSVDHEAQFADRTRGLLARHGLSEYAEVVHAPLESVTTDVGASRWYRPTALEDALGDGATIDLLIVDGPPGKDQPMARYPALPQLKARLADAAAVVVDDADREDERRMVARWRPDGAWTVHRWEVEKGVVVLTRG